MYAIVLLIIAYLIGSFPSALVIGKGIKKIDIREYGSKNLGSTNAIRVLGKKLGLTIFLLDVLKGAIPVGIARLFYEYFEFKFTGNFSLTSFTVFSPLYYGIMAVVGHIFPIFANFKGGKAVATGLGITFVLAPVPAVLCLVVFWITLKISGYVSLSSTFAILTVVITSILQYFFFQDIFGYITVESLILFGIISSVMIIKHRKNYIRILNGTENSFKKKKEMPKEPDEDLTTKGLDNNEDEKKEIA